VQQRDAERRRGSNAVDLREQPAAERSRQPLLTPKGVAAARAAPHREGGGGDRESRRPGSRDGREGPGRRSRDSAEDGGGGGGGGGGRSSGNWQSEAKSMISSMDRKLAELEQRQKERRKQGTGGEGGGSASKPASAPRKDPPAWLRRESESEAGAEAKHGRPDVAVGAKDGPADNRQNQYSSPTRRPKPSLHLDVGADAKDAKGPRAARAVAGMMSPTATELSRVSEFFKDGVINEQEKVILSSKLSAKSAPANPNPNPNPIPDPPLHPSR
jgi:hypothetical protein